MWITGYDQSMGVSGYDIGCLTSSDPYFGSIGYDSSCLFRSDTDLSGVGIDFDRKVMVRYLTQTYLGFGNVMWITRGGQTMSSVGNNAFVGTDVCVIFQ